MSRPEKKGPSAKYFPGGMMQRMRRLGRWTLNGLTALSVVLCVATVALWVRSYSHSENFSSAAISDFGIDDRFWRRDRYVRAEWGRVTFASEYYEWASVFAGISQGRPRPAHFDERGLSPQSSSFRAYQAMTWVRRMGGFELVWPRFRTNDPAGYDQSNYTERVYSLTVPLWALTVLLCVLPLASLVRAIRRLSAARAGHCVSCSYDLTGNVSGVCPECGMAIAKAI